MMSELPSRDWLDQQFAESRITHAIYPGELRTKVFAILSAYASDDLKTEAEYREAIDYEAAKYVYRAAWPDPDLSDYDAVRSIVDAALGIGETDE
jgi:hypothetical protein